jgi:hypothetical protein
MKLVLTGLVFCLIQLTFAQAKQELNDSTPIHSVRKAIILSAALPGSGQVYNHLAMPKGKKNAFWKVPLIYAGLGASGFMLYNNQRTQLSLKKEYTNRIEGNPTDSQWDAYDNTGVLTLYNQYLNQRDLSILLVGAVYIFQIADAGIEAHFVRFDISKDLSMQIKPTVIAFNRPAISATINFR